MSDRKVAIPGEVIAKGRDFLPGEWTEKRNEEIVALRFGVVEETNNLVKIIPVSGPYQPRRGNAVIGEVVNVLSNGWFIDIDTPESAFLSLSEVPGYVNKGELAEVLDVGSIVVSKITNVNKRGIDLTIRMSGLGQIEDGIVIRINSNKVPRVIGKEGSMINLIKEHTKCDITVGQNGVIWISGKTTEEELFAKKAIMFIVDNFFEEGLTEKVEKWFAKEEKGK
ncbi:MAG TPA: exosome complex RNA-binding protein Rrp4 [Candidatus Omnitrophota bacterium]|nr:exosome complex RNA-binding protein Rrp4 [Candidatus Omnitrophota bacterium]